MQEGLDIGGQRRQHRLQERGQHAEGLDAGAADILQPRFHAFLLGQLPGLVGVDILVDAVGQRHHLADRLAVFALGVQLDY